MIPGSGSTMSRIKFNDVQIKFNDVPDQVQ
jgi:hypothetical protein